ncbi:MAG: hypothetical protein Q8R72_00055 [Hylemonella sp.]|nr:hypothetical protein [Hylemonella sp.]
MPTLDEVYAKFGEAAEAAQLLELELGNSLIFAAVDLHGLAKIRSKSLGRKLIGEIDRKTLGQLLASLRKSAPPPPELEAELAVALSERNRLNHSFYRQHNFRRNSDEGRTIMMADLQVIHERILGAYTSLMIFSGTDVQKNPIPFTPVTHLNLEVKGDGDA